MKFLLLCPTLLQHSTWILALLEGSVPVLGVRSLELDFWCFRVSVF